MEKCGKIGAILSGEVIQVIGTELPDSKWEKIKEDIIMNKLEYMKYLKIRWIAVLLVAVGTSFFFGFKSGDNRSFQVAKNLDIFKFYSKGIGYVLCGYDRPEQDYPYRHRIHAVFT